MFSNIKRRTILFKKFLDNLESINHEINTLKTEIILLKNRIKPGFSPIYCGNNSAIIQFETGEYICVDTNSIDSIDLLVGWPYEIHIMPVFRRFLTPEAVVLDIGANFGVYSAVAGRIVGRRGRLYSFEANPHTYHYLRRTARANLLIYNPNVTLVNALVGAKEGRGTLYFNPEELGGATVIDTQHWGDKRQSIELPMVTIDQSIPADLAVDLVKIDVEGAEPLVLQGMEATIRRSPNIRFVMEFFDHMVEHTFGAKRFADYIDSLGFRLCIIQPDSTLRLLDRGVPPDGSHYCLMTRTPELDGAF